MEGGYEVSKLTFDDTEQSMIQKSPEKIEKVNVKAMKIHMSSF